MKWLYLLIICFLFSCSNNNKQLYEEKMEDLQHKLEFGRYNLWIDKFKKYEDRFPDSLNEVYLAQDRECPVYFEFIVQQYYVDVFSKKNKWVGYFPIYDSDDSKIISYILLSAGIDGKLDNAIDSSDKLHLDDWKQKLHLYNPDEFDNGAKAYIEERPYSAKEERSGNKDLLIYVHHLCGL